MFIVEHLTMNMKHTTLSYIYLFSINTHTQISTLHTCTYYIVCIKILKYIHTWIGFPFCKTYHMSF